jgi:alkylation response protein AidB-like acyl-CoA dehydrogenase
MADKYFSPRNVKFMMNEVFDIEDVLRYPHFSHLDKETVGMILDTTIQIADNIARPASIDMDKNQAEFENGGISVHPNAKKYMKAMGEAGLIGAISSMEDGGSQLPVSLTTISGYIHSAANNGITSFTGLTAGAANLIVSFGSEELKQTYIPKMYAGEWQGTMCLTEPQAGSSLHYITSSATPTEDGHYKIKGHKIYITCGDHDVENVVHLYLAKIDGAPAGTKGISLFVVPKKRIENGQLVDNDVKTIGIFHKMGQKGTPAIHLEAGANGDCRGWLVGEPHKGLSYMFQMMNEARIGVGITGAAIASAAYYHSLQYAQERPQGQKLSIKGQDANAPQTLIINHPDVKRMLLLQKAIFEGSLSLIFQAARYADFSHVAEGEEKEKYQLLLDFLTPVVKTYPTEMGIQSVSAGMQVFGGGGYCEDFPLEKLYRDIRITAIYEGTTGIQSLALLGRNITMKNGKAAMAYFQEVQKTIADAQTYDELKKYAAKLGEAATNLQKVTQHLVSFAMKGDVERYLADATLYMEMFGIVAVAWQWLLQGTAAKKSLLKGGLTEEETAFYESKIHTMKFFFAYEIPKTLGLAARLMDDEVLTTEATVESALFV